MQICIKGEPAEHHCLSSPSQDFGTLNVNPEATRHSNALLTILSYGGATVKYLCPTQLG